jgi:hypothetical protein
MSQLLSAIQQKTSSLSAAGAQGSVVSAFAQWLEVNPALCANAETARKIGEAATNNKGCEASKGKHVEHWCAILEKHPYLKTLADLVVHPKTGKPTRSLCLCNLIDE